MRHHLNKLVLICLIVTLTACQTNPVTQLFSPYTSSNNLTQTVQEALMRSDDPLIAQVQVANNQNTIILSGYVKKIRQSDLAEQIARQVPWVQTVENNIIVRQ
jgi:hyperosmotically inducible protein